MSKESVNRHNIEDYAAVEAVCDAVPVYSFNNLIYIYGQSPDFYPDVIAQKNNNNPVEKLKLKKSWEIENNYIGFCHEMTPRTRENDSQPYLPVHLIDGDPTTIWASFESFMSEDQEEWIRIDLPAESDVKSISLKCIYDFMGHPEVFMRAADYWYWGNSLPRELIVKTSCDAWHWNTVFETNDLMSCAGVLSGDPEKPDSVDVLLDKPKRAKQIWIGGKGFSKMGYNGTMFSISGVEVKDPGGRDLALISCGAGVTVSSTSDAHNSDRYCANTLWGPLQYDLGVKWVKIGSDNGSLLWCFTEHEKGKLEADRDADDAVTDAFNKGINVILTLDFMGNWIYEDPPRKTNWKDARFREINESYLCGVQRVDSSPEMFAAYLKYIEYMTEHFRDRVAFFEISNEYKIGMDDDVNWYKNTIFEPTYDVIKRVAPDAKICMCGANGFQPDDILSLLGTGVYIDAGKLYIQGRTLLSSKDKTFSDVIVEMDAECDTAHGIIMRQENMSSFMAAVYDPSSSEIGFAEFVGNNSWDGRLIVFKFSDYKLQNTVSAPGLTGPVHMTAKSEGNTISLTVTDGKKTYSSVHQVEKAAIKGGAGIIKYSGTDCGVFSNLQVKDLSGNVILSDHIDQENPASHWDLHCNHWGDKTRQPAAERIDAVAWHPLDIADGKYFNAVKEFRECCKRLGFNGDYFANEIYAGAAYPPGPLLETGDLWWQKSIFRMTDIQEAKSYSSSMAGHGSPQIESGPCHVHFSGYPHPQSVCRTTVPSQVVAPSQPKPSYYVIRNLSTIMDDFYEFDFPVLISDNNGLVYFTLEKSDKTERMIAMFLEAPWTDEVKSKSIDIKLTDINVKDAYFLDSFNGTEQKLIIGDSKSGISLNDIVVKDYPVFIRLAI